MDYRIFRPSFTARDGQTRRSKSHHVEFKDHLDRRQRVLGFSHARDTEKLAHRLLDLVRLRRNGEPLPEPLRRWLDTLPDKLRARLAEMELISTAGTAGVDRPLRLWLDNDSGEGPPGWRQVRLAVGITEASIAPVIQRVRDVLTGCGFALWRDLTDEGATDAVSVYLGKRREAGGINGTTLNYAARDVRSFCRWLADRLGREAPLQKLADVENEEADAQRRRELTPDEMRLLITAAAAGPVRQGLTGEERAFLYRFSYETGMRPGQVRALTVADFDLDAETPRVHTHARHVKRRKPHAQILTAELAADLRERFANKLPTAPALRMPSRYHMAEMLRADLADARAAWLEEKGLSDKQQDTRRRGDCLAAVNHRGEAAVFYSLRHAHGSALAAAGVPESVIAASMDHASRTTTRRYIHTRDPEKARAIAALPRVAYPQPAEPRKRQRKRRTGS